MAIQGGDVDDSGGNNDGNGDGDGDGERDSDGDVNGDGDGEAEMLVDDEREVDDEGNGVELVGVQVPARTAATCELESALPHTRTSVKSPKKFIDVE